MKILTEKWKPSAILLDPSRDGVTFISDDGKSSFCYSLSDLKKKLNENLNLGRIGDANTQDPEIGIFLLPVLEKTLDTSPLTKQLHHNMEKMQKELDHWKEKK